MRWGGVVAGALEFREMGSPLWAAPYKLVWAAPGDLSCEMLGGGF